MGNWINLNGHVINLDNVQFIDCRYTSVGGNQKIITISFLSGKDITFQSDRDHIERLYNQILQATGLEKATPPPPPVIDNDKIDRT